MPFFFSRTDEPIRVCSNDDPGVTLTYFSARSNLVTGPLVLKLKAVKNNIFQKKYFDIFLTFAQNSRR